MATHKTGKGVYHTTTEEDHPVFHVWSNCPEGEKIEAKNKEWKVTGRYFCEVCARLNPQD